MSRERRICMLVRCFGDGQLKTTDLSVCDRQIKLNCSWNQTLLNLLYTSLLPTYLVKKMIPSVLFSPIPIVSFISLS